MVRLTEVKENGDVAFDDENLDDYRTETVVHEPTVSRVRGLTPGDEVTVEGEVVQAKQTGGPTIFAVADASGVVSCAAFEEAGVRAYPRSRSATWSTSAGRLRPARTLSSWRSTR